MSTIELPDHQLEALADLIADRLAGNNATARTGSLITAAELADLLRVDVKTIYRNADRLGATRPGRVLRFDRARALAAWSIAPGYKRDSGSDVPRKGPGSKPRGKPAGDLLPVGRRS